ncbi:MAG: hypothetical protein GY751_26900 [Bacteroidetes bacterium]|nr:hypothetical protein [Bacteroidota bacterium]
MNSKTIIGGITASFLFFFLGWLIYGILLAGFGESHYNHCMDKDIEDYSWWAMIASNLCWGFLLAILLGWANTWDFIGSVKTGVIFGSLATLGINLQFYATTTVFSSLKVVGFDWVVSMILFAVVAVLTAQISNRLSRG